MIRRASAAGLLAIALLSACGDDADPPARPTTTSAPSGEAGASALELEVTITGSYERRVIHVVRVERPDGKQLFERTLGADRKLREPLAAGDYRVLSFQRQCKAACDAKPTEAELGDPIDLCGSYFAVTATAPTRAVVKLVAGEGCEITFA